MPSPELQLVSQAHDYVEGHSSFHELYLLAGNVLPRLMQGSESAQMLAGAILAAEVGCHDDAERRLAVMRALELKEHAAS